MEEELSNHPRIQVFATDGRFFLKHVEKEYEVIILCLPDPYTAQINRFYTQEFFNLIKNKLHPQGIFAFRISSAENYISSQQGLYLSSLYRSLSSIFKKVIILPGDNNIFLASNEESLLFYDWSKLTERLNQRSISTKYVNHNFLPFRLSQMRIDNLKNALDKYDGKINYDLEPICFSAVSSTSAPSSLRFASGSMPLSFSSW